ncbi:MAG TPA: VWA domain-containing protein [Vicinamibacterales bacterium]
MGRLTLAVALSAMLTVATGSLRAAPPSPSDLPTFSADVDLVTVSAVVRDPRGRPVTDLKRTDFTVFDRGRLRYIQEFRADVAPAGVAVLVDTSGSMELAGKIGRARTAAADLMTDLAQPGDEAAIYAFDTELREVQPFAAPHAIGAIFDGFRPYGATSLYDAIAETARRVAARPDPHRAVIVFTDGLDNASRLTAAEVSGLASAIDVPVYVVAVVSPLDRGAMRGQKGADINGLYATAADALSDLARWTGGYLAVVSSPEESQAAMARIAGELHHQYLLAFEPSEPPGWHPLVVQTANSRLIVHARGGYMAGPARPAR